MMNMIQKHPYLFLLLSFSLLFLIGNQFLSITDTAESNYALTSKEMIQSGNWISPQIYGRYWYDKPILYYWELSLSFLTLGINEFAARFPSAVMGCLSVLLTFWFGRQVYGLRTGITAAVIEGTSVEFWLLSKAVITDTTLFFFLSACIAFFWLGYTKNRNFYYISYLAAAMAVLTKGPIGLALPGLAILLFLGRMRNWRELLHLKLVSGLLLFAAAGCTWYILMYHLHGDAFITNFFGVHNFLRATVPEHPKVDVWYFYIAMFLIGFFPWSFVLLTGLWKKWKEHSLHFREASPVTLWLSLWSAVVFIVFQMIATKYTTYTFPMLFPLSLLTARLITQRHWNLKYLAGFMFLLYIILTFAAAVPAMEKNSGRAVGLALKNLPVSSAPVGIYGQYRTSAVFYSGDNIYRLADSSQIAEMKPDGLSWNAKNVMPFMDIKKFDASPGALVIVEQKKENQFFLNSPGPWTAVAAIGSYVILQKPLN